MPESEKEHLLTKSISANSFRVDPQNSNYTIPRSFGVYKLPLENNAKKFRFGNHPIREIELIREFDEVIRVGLFLDREYAKALASLLNKM